jgi:putative DNA methylase
VSEQDRRFIEESFPVKEVGIAGAREKSIRHGHISTLHTWWARKPLSVSRATAYAALTPYPDTIDGWNARRNFLINLGRWESSLDEHVLEKARADIAASNPQRAPRVLDPFAGGGSMPLEALRLGCEVYANDYNPVSVLLLKATLEYPQKYGRQIERAVSSDMFGSRLEETKLVNPLLDAVKTWGDRVLENVRDEIEGLFPPDPDGSLPVGYYWMRTIPCQNPSCGQQIPLTANFWLSNKDKKKVAVYIDTTAGAINFRIVGEGYAPMPSGFDAERGTIARAVVTCPLCGSVVDDKTTRRLFQEGLGGQRMVAVVLYNPKQQGKTYRTAGASDERAYDRAIEKLARRREELTLTWGLDPVPDETLPLMSGTFNVPLYGLTTWGSLFNARQQLTLITLAEKVRTAYDEMLIRGLDDDFATAVTTYLGITFDWLCDKMSNLTRWHVTGEKVSGTFSRQALGMVWDYFEVNPFSGVTSGWDAASEWTLKVIHHLSQSSIPETAPVTITQASATQLPYPDNYFDAVLTDPPYYNSVPYADLSDFFYVWLKRTIGHLHPDLFGTPLTPKEKEITEMAGWDPVRYAYKDKAFFERNLKLAFQEMHRVLKPDGIAVIVYAHKSTAGWETVINALLDSGLIVTGAWPLNTEMQARMRASEAAALASSIYIVTRKMARQGTGFYNEIREELRMHLTTKLHRLWEEGIGGADFFIAAIGSAIEVFGKYEQVLDYEGNVVRADRLLDEVNTIATDYAVRQILHNGFAAEISDLARFYVLWRWNYGEARVPFDEARKLAQSVGIDLPREWARPGAFIRKDKEFIQVLGPQQRKLDDLEDSRELMDVLHRVLLLWEKGQRAELVQVLSMSGFGRSEAFYRVAQAVSETLPNESREKKLLDGFLTGRERLRDEMGKNGDQQSTFLDGE